MATEATREHVFKAWDENTGDVIQLMKDYISIPNLSPMFDTKWQENGLIDQATELLANWGKKRDLKGFALEIIKLDGMTPVIFATVDGTNGNDAGTILMYGHLDKQPPLTEAWDEGLHPYKPVIKDGKLYGRGGADDGYAICAALLSVEALQKQNIPHARVVIIIEASEESGSPHLPKYMEHLEDRIGTPNLIVCLDSGCGNYEQFWITTSLRGLIAGDLTVKVLDQALHSGAFSGLVPSSFRIMRQLLERLEDVNTGRVKVEALHREIPQQRIDQTKSCAQSLGKAIYTDLPMVKGCKPVTEDLVELLLNKTWRPTLCVTGVEGIPPLSTAGNVLRTHTALKLSIRIPPGVDAEAAGEAVKKVLLADPPYGAEVSFNLEKSASGWESPALADWLGDAMNKGSNYFFNKPANYIGEGGSIPFMGMLGAKYPQAQFAITGVLGPSSNAHGPNEFLHIDQGKKVTATVASILADHYNHFKK